MFSKITVFWFSGTGNSLIIARAFAAELNRHEIATAMRSMPCPVPAEQEFAEGTAWAIIFPVHEQGVPLFIYEWLEAWPENRAGFPVIIISTMAIFSGLVKAPLYRLLIDKGYQPLAVKEIIMPGNLAITLPGFINRRIIAMGKRTVADFAADLIAGRAKWPWRPGFLATLMNKNMLRKLERWIGRRFHADEKCRRCGLCVKLCPMNNISLVDGRLLWGSNCTVCLRCINFCPRQAIRHSLRPLFMLRYRAEGINSNDFPAA